MHSLFLSGSLKCLVGDYNSAEAVQLARMKGKNSHSVSRALLFILVSRTDYIHRPIMASITNLSKTEKKIPALFIYLFYMQYVVYAIID